MTYSIDIYSQSWNKEKTIDLDSNTFSDENINNYLMYQYFRLQRNNGRIVIANTKTRWEVSWSWKKLYRQKWTWTWRAWEKRSPLRKKWWIVFWPRANRNYSIFMTRKSRKKALLSMLISKLKSNSFKGLINFDLPEIKTKKALNVLSNLWLNWSKTLIVLSSLSENTTKSLSNIPWVKYIHYSYLNPMDILSSRNILIEESSIQKVQEWLSL